MKFEWKAIVEWPQATVVRARVIGGWIVKDIIYDNNRDIILNNIVFVPDPNHEWSVE